jgi:hypothetical protein
MNRRARQLYFPLRVPRQSPPPAPAVNHEARRMTVALRETSQPLIDFPDGTKPPPDVLYHLKPRERFRARPTPKASTT